MCGILGIYSKQKSSNNAKIIIRKLSLLQHRGKDGFGIGYNITENNRHTKIVKHHGLVNLNNEYNINNLTHSCIGHVRYSTSGKSKINNKLDYTKTNELQPLNGVNKQNELIIMVHNGNIPIIQGRFDSQVILNLILNSEENLETTLIWIMDNIPAAYCLLIIVNDILYVMRDRYGIRPLSYGESNETICVSSETCAIKDYKNIKDVEPGVILRIDETGCNILYKHSKPVNGLCAFELLYFMNPNSYININNNNIKIELIRQTLGETLAKKELLFNANENTDMNDYIVVGIPNSGLIYAKAYAQYVGIEYIQVIEKVDNCVNGEDRTFILINNEERQKACRKKFKYNVDGIKNKKLIIIDDTIVRGNVISNIIESCKNCGASEIHIRIPSPPILDKCQLGIAIHSKEELIMNNITVNEVKTKLGVNSLMYLSIDDLTMFPKDSYMEVFGCGIAPEILLL